MEQQSRANHSNIATHRLSIPAHPYQQQHANMSPLFEAHACLRTVLEDYNQKPGNPEIRQRVLNILKQHVNISDSTKIESEPTVQQQHQQQQSTSSLLLMQSQSNDNMDHSMTATNDDEQQHLDHEAHSYESNSLNFISSNIVQDFDHQIAKDSQISSLQQHTTTANQAKQQHITKYNVIQRMSSAPSTNSTSSSSSVYNHHQFDSTSLTQQQQQAGVAGNRLNHPPIAINMSSSSVQNRLSTAAISSRFS